jgi:Ca2+-binding RTX toxin-like protein
LDVTTGSGDFTGIDGDGNYYLEQGGNTYTYSFQRTTSDQGTGVEVRVAMIDDDGNTVYTDRVLDDVEAFRFGDQDLTIDDLVGRVINVNTGEKFATIQEAIDDADTIDGHEILVTPGTYNEEAFVDKNLSFFVQDSSGITLTLVNQEDNPTVFEPNIRVLSQANITIKGNDGDNNIEILSLATLRTWDDDNVATLETNSAFNGDESEFELIKHVADGDDISFGSITDFDAASYTIFGLGGDDTLLVSSETTKNHYLFGGSGDDYLSAGQGRDWLDGGSGDDHIYSHGGDDRILGGSDDDLIVLATRDDTAGAANDGRVLVLLGGGNDTLLPGALDTSDGIDLNVFVGDFTKGQDKISFEGLQDVQGGTADISDLADLNLLSGSTIDLSAFEVADGDLDTTNNENVEGSINLLGVNTRRLDATDFTSVEGSGVWFDEYERVLGIS